MTFLPARLERDVVLRSLVNHSVPGVERVDAARGTVTRLVHTPTGMRPVTVHVHDDGIEVVDGEPIGIEDVEGERVQAANETVIGIVRDWFDLDTDVAEIAGAFADDPVLGPLVLARPAVRIIGHPDPFEAAMQTVLGQQVSLAACRTFTGRLAAAYGTHGPDGLIDFPNPHTVAAAQQEQLRAAVGITTARARTVLALAAAFDDGLVLRRDADDSRAELLALPGIGPWTVDYLALRVLRDPDAFPVGDLVLRRALGGVTPAEATAKGEAWRPWRAYATMQLWTADAVARAASSP